MASAVKGAASASTASALAAKKTLLGLNRLGASLTSLGKIQSQIRDVLSIQLKTSKDVKAFKLKRTQYLRDQESERQTELAGQTKGEVVDKEEVKKEGEKKLSWLEKLLGPFKGIVEFALRTIITQGILRWMSDPKNGERLQKVVGGLSKFFGFVFGIVSWSIGSFMSGISNVFGDGSKGGISRFAEVLGGLGQILIGIAGLKAAMYLLNPFSLIGDILGLLDIASSKDTSAGVDVPDKPSKPGPPVGPQRNALTKFGRKAFVGVLGKGGAKSALTFFKKTVSPLLKKIPIIGGLIDFAINVFVFKESPGKAAFKAIGAGLLTWLGGAIGSVIPGPGTLVGALLGGMAGDALGGLLYDAIFGKKKKKDDEPALAEGGLITKPTRAMIGERGPEIVIPLAMMGGLGGIGPIASVLSSALTGALSAMGSSGELAKQVIGDDLAEMQKQSGNVRPAQPGETLGKSVVKTTTKISDLGQGSGLGDINSQIGDKSSYGKNSSRNTLRGALANILGVFESISKKSFRTGGGSGGTGGGGTTGDDSAGIDASGIEAATGSVVDKGISIAKKFMSNLGLTKESAAAIAGNFAHESGGFIPGIREGGPFGKNSKPWPKGTVGAGYGWAQWTNSVPGDRYDKFIQSYGGDYSKIPTNEDNFKFAVQEMRTTNKLSDNFKKMTDVAAATVWFRKNWERAGVHHDEPRIKYAKGILAKLAIGGKLPISSEEYKEKWSGDGRDEIIKKYSSGGKAIVEGAKKIVGKGRGTADQCANTTRAALQAAQHPTANKTTSVGDLDTPKGSSYSKGKGFAASFGGSDMGTIIKDKSQIKAGDILLWKADRNLGGSSNKGAITHVGIAADDGLKHQYDHNVSRGFHYRPHWDSSGGTSWLAGIRLGGSGTIGPGDDSSDGKSTGGSDTEEKEQTVEEQIQSIIGKMTSSIMKLGGASAEDKDKVIPKTTDAKIESVPEAKSKEAQIPPAPRNVSITAPAASSGASLDKLSITAASLEEDNKIKMSVVPIPTVINNGSTSVGSAPPKVVRARTPITYGF